MSEDGPGVRRQSGWRSMTPHEDGTGGAALDRRTFVVTGVVGGALAVAEASLPRLARADRGTQPRRATGGEDQDFALAETTIDRLQEGMKSGQLTARSIAEQYL